MSFSPKGCNTKTTCEAVIHLKLANVAISEVDDLKTFGVNVSKNPS